MGRRDNRRALDALVHPAALVIIAVAVVIALVICLRPPAPRSAAIAQDEFSADRAWTILTTLLPEPVPHVAGSTANLAVRQRIENFLSAEGYQPEVQSLFHCNPRFGSCADVQNIIAVKPGAASDKAILVTAHYDSSWTSPGAADDGAGTAAVLEIARMAARLAEFRNDIIFLITDGEELGLIGAHAFAEYHPAFSRVAAVINLEARGVTGPSSMFETGDGNRSLIRILSKNLERPVANSLAFEVYKRMPNDTDYSVYKERGVQGLNFAFSGGVAVYHSSLDDLDHLDRGSLQHHGQNAWSMLLALADRDIADLHAREDAAYIDAFGHLLWHYPQSIASGVTMVLTVLLLIGVVIACKTQLRPAAIFWAIVSVVTALVLLGGGALALSWPLGHWVETNAIEHPNPWAGRLAIIALCALVVWMCCKLFAHRVTFGAATIVCWSAVAGLAFWLDFKLAAASFIALIPMAAFVIGMLLDVFRWRARRKLVLATTFGFALACYMGFYHFFLLDVVLSFELAHLKAATLALPLILILPACFARYKDPIPDWRPAFVLAGVVAAIALIHQLMPGFQPDRPRGMNLVYRQGAEQGDALVYLETPGATADRSYTEVMNLVPQDVPSRYATRNVRPYGGSGQVERYAIPVNHQALAGPEVAVTGRSQEAEGSAQRLTLVVRTPAESEQLVLSFPESAGVHRVLVEGVTALDHAEAGKRGPARALQVAYPAEELTVQLFSQSSAAFPFAVTVRQPFPAALVNDFRAAWPADAQPIFHGSRSEIVAEFQLPAD